ncbi:B12-binding domain-containing radical SAM protein [Saccharothrix australiensis]|uniref:Radical SAM superfamily enzyme YgiQ (UPF0313 family) n=1 Tax=Saccharothrix australiensis TaxID=2072 RepID=A0A495VZG8_9PSEU|nr:radical SAM protein [Saccharothrix australiensis]RKT54270.1 radical SAM superfamily enzyme YgiQ (UPF0313 family) [Saccharothrix australiensis]
MYFNSTYLAGTMFDPEPGPHVAETLRRAGLTGLRLTDFGFEHSGRDYALLRPVQERLPHLTTFTLESILQAGKFDYAHVDLEHVWRDDVEMPGGDFKVVLLSTSFIWNQTLLATAVGWVERNLPGVPIVVGGQYTNLKFMPAMNHHDSIVAVVRGDGEAAIPAVLDALANGGSMAGAPNVVWRDGDRIRINPIEYVDMDEWPSPGYSGRFPVVPYESMRGCPFDCKFCSFPAASPKWRYKSAEKIRDDWVRYAGENESKLISAMDSTFTIPPTRLRRLLEILPDAGVAWEGFSRANTVGSVKTIEGLRAAHCEQLHIGFESMNEGTLKLMSKRVTAKQNRQALHALRTGGMGYTVFFIVGYPGETPEMFADTRDFLVEEYDGHFMLNLFTITDETMPLWQDRERLRIQADDPEDPDSNWSHIGMTRDDALALQADALDRVRRRNDRAVYLLWQRSYQNLMLPHRDRDTNLAVEKCVERLAMAPRDFTDPDRGAAEMRAQLDRLAAHGVRPLSGRPLCTDSL